MVSFCKKAELEADESPLEQELQSLRKTMEHGFALQLSILQDLRHQMTAPRVKRLARPSMESTARLSVESESVPSPSSPSPSSPSMSSLIEACLHIVTHIGPPHVSTYVSHLFTLADWLVGLCTSLFSSPPLCLAHTHVFS